MLFATHTPSYTKEKRLYTDSFLLLLAEMGQAYPELTAQRELIGRVIKEEEDSFLRTLEKGISMLNDAIEVLQKKVRAN